MLKGIKIVANAVCINYSVKLINYLTVSSK